MFGEWLPDVPDFKNPGCIVAENVIPIPGGYAPQPGLNPQGETADGAITSARLMFNANGSAVVVGATDANLFVNTGGTVTQTAYTTAATDPWDFCRYNDFVIATNINNAPQHLSDIDTDTSWSDLGGTPPRAKYCARIGDFLVLGNLDGEPSKIQWSAFNNPGGSWARSRLTQADSVPLDLELGAVQRIVGGRYPMIFQERGVQRIEYVGPPVVWNIVEVEGARGCVAPFSVVQLGSTVYYLAQDGFYATDGNSFDPIGNSRINKWFFDEVRASKITETHGTLDFENNCIVWAFKTGNSFNRFIRYCYTENRWSHGQVTIGRLVETVAGDVTLEQLGALYAALEDIPASLDDPRWQGRNRTMAAFVDGTTTTELNLLNGTMLEANIETGEFQLIPGRRVTTKRARVLGKGGFLWDVAPVAIAYNEGETVGTFTSPMAGGWAPMRADGLSMRVKARAAEGAGWQTVQGVYIDARPSGAR